MANRTESAYVLVRVKAGVFDASASTAAFTPDITVVSFVEEYVNAAPTWSDESPTGSTESANVEVSASCSDDTSCDVDTLAIDATAPDATVYHVYAAGSWLSGWDGSIDANGSNGYDITIDTHPLFTIGTWRFDLSIDDDEAETGSTYWTFTVTAASPAFSEESPTGTMEDPDAEISFHIAAGDWTLDEDTLDLTIVSPAGMSYQVIVDGEWETGYGGSIASDGSGGLDVTVSTHPSFTPGRWSASASISDEVLASGSTIWSWTVAGSVWIDSNTIRRGRVVYILELAGVGVFADAAVDLTGEDWYDDAGYATVNPWLLWGPEDHDETIDFATAELRLNAMRLVIADPGGQMTTLVKSYRAWTHTWLTSTLSDSETTSMDVVDTTDFPSSGAVWIHQERIEYASTTATTFDTLTRGTYGTLAEEHFADSAPPVGAPETPAVCLGPHSITGRRAILRRATIDETGSVESGFAILESTVVYRGRVGKGATVGRGVYEMTLEPLADILLDKVGNELPQTTLQQGYWYSGVSSFDALGCIEVKWTGSGASAPPQFRAVDAGLYQPFSLGDAIVDALDFGYPWMSIEQLWTSSRFGIVIDNGGDDVEITISVRRGDPMWAMGFDEGHIVVYAGATYYAQAQNDPRWCVVDFGQRWMGGFTAGNPSVRVASTHRFLEEAYVAPKGNRHVAVESVVSASNTIVLDGMTYDVGGRQPAERAWIIEDEDDAGIGHVVRVGEQFDQVLLQLLHLAGSQVEPERWMAHGLTDDDIDTDELDAVMAGIPAAISDVRTTVLEPTPVWEILGPQLAMLGICPRITDEGRIGFTRIKTPLLSDATILDSNVWAVREASKITARLDAELVVNQIRVKYGLDYTADGDSEWRPPMTFKFREGSLTNRTRGIVYDCPGLWASSLTRAELENALLDQFGIGQFGQMGREAAVVDIPCVWASRALRCGDVVSVTHPCLPDTVMGQIGVTDRLGVVVGRRHKMTGDGPDIISVRFGPETNAGGIAPCCLLDGGSGSTGTCSDAELYSPSGVSDLSWYTVGDEVTLTEVNSASPSEMTVGIAAIDTESSPAEVTFDEAVFSTLTAPVWMVPASWDSASSYHQGFAYVADDADSPKLGTGDDDPKEWTL